MRKSVVVFLLTFGVSITAMNAQTDVLTSGGDAFGNGGNSSYSVGQIVYTYGSDATGSSSLGVQQPFEFFTVDVEENPDVCLSMSVYPNPSQSIVQLNVENQSMKNLSYQLFDVSGQMLLTEKINNQISSITLESMASGMYILQVFNNKEIIKSFTIIKKN
ncbi:MAG: T9SS type A sorting domain-containing protein [Bacteroidetes bacterium]|nr:T9SS type A sorting domain-containing protein [Bacteroidota bacterium]